MNSYSRNSNSGKTRMILSCLVSLLALTACSNNDANIPPLPIPPPPPPPATATFDVAVTNLTNAQPLSPLAVVGHQDGYAVFTIGSPATAGLEQLAEGGDNSAFLAEADIDVLVLDTGSGMAAVGPAASDLVSLEVPESDLPDFRISVITMLVNTNDAITGINAVTVGDMAVGDTLSMYGIAYDAGTEANSEMAAHIPGPAGGGEGFNAARDDIADQVSMHSGVVSLDDGLGTSNLGEQHRFDNPVVRITIMRTD